MRICYLDESGVPELDAGTTHYILFGISIPGETWKQKDAQIESIKVRFGLGGREIHTAWMLRRYLEQDRISNFDRLSHSDRRVAVIKEREAYLIRKAAVDGPESVKDRRKEYRKTEAYVHLSLRERLELVRQVADAVNGWKDCVLFAECTDKTSFSRIPTVPPHEEAFTQVVTRFHSFLSRQPEPNAYGILVHDRNETNASKLTTLMRMFHRKGTPWLSQIPLLIETPLFVDSVLTSMVQVADVCAYATRRYCERGEEDLFGRIFDRFNQDAGRWVGVRHYTGKRACQCRICQAH